MQEAVSGESAELKICKRLDGMAPGCGRVALVGQSGMLKRFLVSPIRKGIIMKLVEFTDSVGGSPVTPTPFARLQCC